MKVCYLDHEPGAGTAALALVEEEGEVRRLYSVGQVGVVQNYQGGLAPQFKGHTLERD